MHDLITLWSSFLAGLFSAITPCNYILFPILLFQFGLNNKESKIQYKKIFLFVSIFLLVIIIAGFFFSSLIPYTTFKFIFGGTLITWGFYQIKNPGHSLIKNKQTQLILLALLTPFVVTLSPCSVPFFSAFITLQATSPSLSIILNFLLFGLGLLSPSLLLAILGNKFSQLIEKTYKITTFLDKFAGFLIIFSGFYFIYQIQSITQKDLLITGGIILLITVFYFYKVITTKKTLFLQDLLIFFLSWLMFAISFSICSRIVPNTVQTVATCQAKTVCPHCQLCGIIFIIWITITVFLYQFLNKKILFLIKHNKVSQAK